MIPKTCLLLCCVANAAFCADPQGPLASGFLTLNSAEEISSALSERAAYLDSSDGRPLLVLKIAVLKATAVRLHVANLHLPVGSELLVYGLNANGRPIDVASYKAGRAETEFWTAPVGGSIAVLELQIFEEAPADLPYRILAAEGVTPSEASVHELPGDWSEPLIGRFQGRLLPYRLRSGQAYFEDDILLGEPDAVGGGTSSKQSDRGALAITEAKYRWPGGRIPYSISSNLPDTARVTEAVAHWNQMLGGYITFVPRSTESNHLFINRSSSCSAYVGMQGFGAQLVNLGDSCTTGNVIHELGHAVGLWHEQSREDRDRHIRILWANIGEGARSNFNQIVSQGDDIGLYDFNSIMHYNAYAFSANGQPTMETIPAGIPIGQRGGLSAGDVNAVRQLYAFIPAAVAVQPVLPPPVQPPPSIQYVSVSVTTNPAGQTVVVDGVTLVSPATLNWVANSTHTIGAPDHASAGTKLTVAGWSDQGAQFHTVQARPEARNFKADFRASYQLVTEIYPSGAGLISVSPEAFERFYALNTSVVLSATAAAGYCFSNWSGAIASTPPVASLAISSPATMRATFVSGVVSLSSTFTNVPVNGTFLMLGVTGNTACRWTTTNVPSWATLFVGASGTGNGLLMMNIGRNTTGGQRQATLNIAGQNHVLTQAAE